MHRSAPIASLLLATTLAVGASGCSLFLFVIARDGNEGDLAVGEPVSGDTEDARDDESPSCASEDGGGGGDQRWRFVPPATGVYAIRVDASYDAVLAVHRDGDEIACNDDAESANSSQLELQLEKDVEYEIIVDAYDEGYGSYTLSATPSGVVQPPMIDVPPGVPTPTPAVENVATMQVLCAQATTLAAGRTTGTLIPTDDAAVLSCGGGQGADAVFAMTLTGPTALTLREESELDAIVEVRAGCSQPHEVLACAGGTSPARIEISLDAGTYYVIVSASGPGVGGPFTLELETRSIDRVPPREP